MGSCSQEKKEKNKDDRKGSRYPSGVGKNWRVLYGFVLVSLLCNPLLGYTVCICRKRVVYKGVCDRAGLLFGGLPSAEGVVAWVVGCLGCPGVTGMRIPWGDALLSVFLAPCLSRKIGRVVSAKYVCLEDLENTRLHRFEYGEYESEEATLYSLYTLFVSFSSCKKKYSFLEITDEYDETRVSRAFEMQGLWAARVFFRENERHLCFYLFLHIRLSVNVS